MLISQSKTGDAQTFPHPKPNDDSNNGKNTYMNLKTNNAETEKQLAHINAYIIL